MKNSFASIILILFTTSLTNAQQNISYVSFPSGLYSLAAYSSLYNTQNSRNDSMFAQKFRLNYFSLAGAKVISSLKGRYINPSTVIGSTRKAILSIGNIGTGGIPAGEIWSDTISVSNVDNGNGSTYKDITVSVPNILVVDSFYVGIKAYNTDTVQFFVGNTGCACQNVWLYGPSYLNAGDDAWRALVSRHASQDLNIYFDVRIDSPLGIKNIVEDHKVVVASPVKDEIVFYSSEKVKSIEIYNVTGKSIAKPEVSALNSDETKYRIPFSNFNLSSGIYFLKINDHAYKFIKL